MNFTDFAPLIIAIGIGILVVIFAGNERVSKALKAIDKFCGWPDETDQRF